MSNENQLFYGDNLDVLRLHIKDDTVDLIYLDPPFNSNQDYNILFEEKDGSRSKAQIIAFEDTWHWDQEAARAYDEITELGGRTAEAMIAFRKFLGDTDMMAYLSMMAPRLVELRRVLKPTGSIYLHCDPTASHYLKMLMDAIFGPKCFRNEIIWSYRRWPSPTNHYQRMHNDILFYAKTAGGPETFKVEFEENSPSYQKRFKGKTQMLDPETGTRKITLDKNSPGLARRDVWDISMIAGFAKNRMGYPTQKPPKLLERIIATSSNEGDLVLDPFCGCGTTIVVAQELKRKWIGIDITHLAITLIKHQLQNAFGEQANPDVIGEPHALPDAQTLAEQNPYQFQWWALGKVGARPIPAEQKKGADRGIDGRLYFHDDPRSRKDKQIIISVKAGNTNPAHLRDLRGVLEREDAEIGVLITMQEPTKPMLSEAAGGGFYNSPWGKHPRIQILTIAELLAGKRIDYPPHQQVNTTYKNVPKSKGKPPKAGSFLGETGEE